MVNNPMIECVKNIIRGGARKVHFIVKKIILNYVKRLKLRERLVVESFLGNKSDSNIDSLLEKLIKREPEEKVYYVVKSKKKYTSNANLRYVKKNSIKHIFLMHSSKWIITNSRLHNSLIEKRVGQTILQMWHGTPMKKLAFDQPQISFLNADSYLESFKIDVEKWDYLWVPNSYAEEKLVSAFRYKGKIIRSMYPSDNVMLELNNEYNNMEIKAKLEIPVEKNVILYMPTFREELQIIPGKYEVYDILDIAELSEKYPQSIILVRYHYLVEDINILLSNVINVSNYKNVNDLYRVADVLITDYSSAMFSFGLLNKPIYCIQLDYDEYSIKRGLYADAFDWVDAIIIRDKQALKRADFLVKGKIDSKNKIDMYPFSPDAFFNLFE